MPNMKYDAYRVYTNLPACGAQRGHGGVIARACWEQQLDMIAEELAMDPIELRLKNMMVTGDVTCNDLNMSSLGMRECIEAVRDRSEWKHKKGKLPKGRGIGMACGFFVSGAGFPIYRSDTYHGTVIVKLTEDGGTALVYTASAEIGQGSDTAFAMIAAEALGIPLEWVRLESGDTDFGVDLGAYSSRQTLMTGQATKEAAEDAKRQVLEVLSEVLDVPVADMDVKRGLIINRVSVEAQMQGAIYMGLGEALYEEVKFDDEGRVRNADLAEYKMPTARDMPPIDAVIVESNEPNGPFGAKEVGEGAIMPTIPAVLNALSDAVGVRLNELPLTPERVYLAIKEYKNKSELLR
ncbi:molybdopterin cofactor-binding domain-containing protein [Desulfosarcina ovata]|uniref:molybdopterin cofactor-binding domain-containing protein n=1 Tax=Desulfosarcina ovata TaxID=83564 RepID=UPI001E4521D8|nr:molybdopterin cofactor-binding domain-containing protein [Desulfosarcina ovata]